MNELKLIMVYDFQIEVQPDMRFVTQYLLFTTLHEYPDLEIKGYPYVYLPALVAYKLTIFSGHFLISDLTYRRERSFSSAPYTNESELMELLATLKTCPVPQDVQTLLDHIAPVQDSQRCNLKFIPSFAAFTFTHDFGYSLPISTYLSINDILASNRTNYEPDIIMAKIYNTVLTRIGTTSYTISNLFEGPYSFENNTYQHRNWFCSALESFINPVVTRALVQRPTFAKIKTVPQTADTPAEVDGYHYLLGNPFENDSSIIYFLTDLKRFYRDTSPSLSLLGISFSKSSGLNIMTHSIETICLPTFHKFDVIKIDDTEKTPPAINILSDKDYAAKAKFMESGPTFTKTFLYPEDESTIDIDLYRVENATFDPNENPITYELFSARTHVGPNVLWFQP